MNFVIIGGDAAGMSAASRAKRNNPQLAVIVFEKTGDVSYSACGMPYNIADSGRDMDDLVVRAADVFRAKQGIDLRAGHLVQSIDREKKVVSGINQTTGEAFVQAYDKLLIATGGRPIIPKLPGFNLPGVMALKSLEDGRRIKDYLAKGGVKRVAIIGMGYIGLEMAEALRERGLTVEMIKPGPELLPWLARELADVVREELVRHEVGVSAGHEIVSIEEDGSGYLLKGRDRSFAADMVLVAIGLEPNSELAREAGLSVGPGNAIAVDSRMQTGDPDIYAAGDCADAIHLVTGDKTWIPLALRANRAGWAVADNIGNKDVKLDGIVGTAVFRVFDLEVARSGLNEREADRAGFDPVSVTIKSRSRAHAHPGAQMIWVHLVADRKSGRLLGAQMVGREGVAHRINAVAVALHARMSLPSFAQTDLAYAPPFGPVWDPLLTAANQLIKELD